MDDIRNPYDVYCFKELTLPPPESYVARCAYQYVVNSVNMNPSLNTIEYHVGMRIEPSLLESTLNLLRPLFPNITCSASQNSSVLVFCVGNKENK